MRKVARCAIFMKFCRRTKQCWQLAKNHLYNHGSKGGFWLIANTDIYSFKLKRTQHALRRVKMIVLVPLVRIRANHKVYRRHPV